MIRHGLLAKEWMESARTYRALVVPLVFLLTAVAQPIAYYFMPAILDQAGLPEGLVIQMPAITSVDVVRSVFDQFTQLGTLVIVLVTMGMISREMETGTAALLFSMGVPRHTYFAAKWLPAALLAVGSTLLATLGAAYYTAVLFDPVPWSRAVLAALVYSLQLVFVATVTLAVSAVVANQLVAAVSAIVAAIVLGLVGAVAPGVAPWLPFYAGRLAQEIVAGAEAVRWGAVLSPAVWTAVVYALGTAALIRRDM